MSGRVFRPLPIQPGPVGLVFQSPLCRGGSSDTPLTPPRTPVRRVSIPSVSGRVFRHISLFTKLAARVVSIPSVSGRVFRRRSQGCGARERPGFNPLCVGAGLQTDARVYCVDARVSIPSVSGRVFRRFGSGEQYGSCWSFNPLCVGAGLQTSRGPSRPRSPRRFNPLCVGAGLQTRAGVPFRVQRRPVSIPSVSGRVFRRVGGELWERRGYRSFNPLCVGAGLQTPAGRGVTGGGGTVSIPSVSGRVFRRRGPHGGRHRGGGFNPLCVGAGLQTRARNATRRTTRRFQSPLCRGGSSDPVRGGRCYVARPLT